LKIKADDIKKIKTKAKKIKSTILIGSSHTCKVHKIKEEEEVEEEGQQQQRPQTKTN
jgi:hypothetical protein